MKVCFVLSQYFSVAKLTRYFKLGSKPGRLYDSQISYPKDSVSLCIN